MHSTLYCRLNGVPSIDSQQEIIQSIKDFGWDIHSLIMNSICFKIPKSDIVNDMLIQLMKEEDLHLFQNIRTAPRKLFKPGLIC